MGKTVFMFPGQGAQYIGMAKDFYDAIPECREVFEEASEASGLDIAALCFEENDKINITEQKRCICTGAQKRDLHAGGGAGGRSHGSSPGTGYRAD